MVVKQFKYVNKEEAIKRVGFDFVQSFYIRPDGEDRGWDEYHVEEQPRIEEFGEILEKEPKRLVSLLIVYSDTHEVSAVFEFEKGPLLESTEREFRILLSNDEQGNPSMQVGIDCTRFLFAESY